jgi:hypothetical protein
MPSSPEQVIEHQLTALSDAGMIERGDALPGKINDLQAYIMFGTKTVPDANIKPGEGPARVCLSMKANDGSMRYRQFRLDLLHYDDVARVMLARHARGQLTSAAARDTIGLLRDEAEYMHRVGRHEEAEQALCEAAAIRP